MNIRASVIARQQGWALKHYAKTKYGKQLAALGNSHPGESCFIIGNGPSLTVEDLESLRAAGIDTFAVNRIFKLFPQTAWRPTYYVNTDELLLRDCLPEVDRMDESILRLLTLENKYYHGIHAKGALYFPVRYGQTELRINSLEGVRDLGTVTTACMQLAAYMGYTTLYLLGIDHNFDKIITDEGEITIDPSVTNHFCADYADKNTEGLPTDIGQMTRAYMKMKPFLEENGVKVYNATRTTKLTVYEQIPFEEAVANCPPKSK